MKSKKLIVGNWKMNPTFLREAKDLAAKVTKLTKGVKHSQVVLCPPDVFLGVLADGKKSRQPVWGAQDLAVEWDGAYTGGVSAPMLASSGASYVIVGHSERRVAGDSDAIINRKLKLALRAGLQPILCIGETTRDEHGNYLKDVSHQLLNALEGITKDQVKKIIIAYEPAWAIGAKATGADTPEAFDHNAIYIRKIISSRKGVSGSQILYGGSISLKNAAAFLKEGKADGLLIGRESLNPKNFSSIVRIADAK